MDFQNTDLRGGSLQISTEVIGKIARCAALEIDGVAEVSCGRQNKKLKDLLEASSIQSPVVVEMRDGTANITLNLMMSFGARIPAVAEKVQENVKNAVQNMTNVTVSRVNLVICPPVGVYLTALERMFISTRFRRLGSASTFSCCRWVFTVKVWRRWPACWRMMLSSWLICWGRFIFSTFRVVLPPHGIFPRRISG